MRETIIAATVSVCLLGLTACGGGALGGDDIGDASKDGAIDAGPTLWSGKVIDGYVGGAKVCLDTNASLTCDGDEPSTTSAEDGGFQLDVSGVSESTLADSHLLATVSATSVDSDDNGANMATAGRKPYRMLAPVHLFNRQSFGTSDGFNVSPISTLVSFEMIINNIKNVNNAITQVKQAIPSVSEWDNSRFSDDFVAKEDTDRAAMAKVLATQLEHSENAAEVAAADFDEQAKAMIAARNAIANASKLLATLGGDGALTNSNARAKAIEYLMANEGNIAYEILVQQQDSLTAPITADDNWSEGIYTYDACLEPENQSRCDPSAEINFTIRVNGNGLTGRFWNGLWSAESAYPGDVMYSNGTWTSRKDLCGPNSGSALFNDSTNKIDLDCREIVSELTLRSMDISGQTRTDMMNFAGNTSTPALDFTFPPGSKAYTISETNLRDYVMVSDDEGTRTTRHQIPRGFIEAGHANIFDFMAAHSGVASGVVYGEDVDGNILLLTFPVANASDYLPAEHAQLFDEDHPFRIAEIVNTGGLVPPLRVVPDLDYLFSETMFVLDTVEDLDGVKRKPLVTIYNGEVWYGYVIPAGAKWTFRKVAFNKPAFDATMEAFGYPVPTFD